MLELDLTRMRSRYVYILKVTADYVYVAYLRSGNRLGDDYRTKSFRDHTVSLVPIPEHVAREFKQHNPTSDFFEPRLAAINYYQDDVVSIEIQRKNPFTGEFQSPERWRSTFAHATGELAKYKKDNRISALYSNGRQIILAPEGQETRSHQEDGFYTTQVSQISFSIFGFNPEIRKRNLDIEALDACRRDEGSANSRPLKENLFCPTEAVMLSYTSPGDTRVTSNGPVVGLEERTPDGESALTLLEQSDYVASCNAVLNAARVASEFFPDADITLLDIPRLLINLKTPCPANMPTEQLRRIPSHIPIRFLALWLFGLQINETRLTAIREVHAIFSLLLRECSLRPLSFEEVYCDTEVTRPAPLSIHF